ncbi:MAG TPA: nickel pincer cofactor biosynthesis protein LarC [Anaerolineaceae bacterium]|nr:nickel pincer cofactor biosynthesis protein LarC [Anaerolineaceae bacterium]
MKIAYADCFSGISGDMFLAALLDAGLPLDVLQQNIDKLNLPEKVELKLTETHKGALRAASLEVIVPHSHNHRHLADILEMINTSALSDKVKITASKIFQLLAEAESHVHGEPVDHVHFHEVGALDSIVDIVGAAIGLDYLGIEQLYASPLPYGSGTINSDHGLLPLPAPATLEVLRLINAPLTPSSAEVELVTPTGAAILGCLAEFKRPNLVMTHIGIGAGKRDLEWPNILRMMIGVVPEAEQTEMVQLETNIDDMNPQFFGYLMDKLFASGARDVFMTSIHMKKNRPGILLGVIALRKDEAALAELLLRETTTLGLRVQPIGRYEASREFRQLDTPFGKVTIKAKIMDGKVIHATPEYDDCVRLAKENQVSLLEIYQTVNHHLKIE